VEKRKKEERERWVFLNQNADPKTNTHRYMHAWQPVLMIICWRLIYHAYKSALIDCGDIFYMTNLMTGEICVADDVFACSLSAGVTGFREQQSQRSWKHQPSLLSHAGNSDHGDNRYIPDSLLSHCWCC
jgi:hypothetical protein